MASNLSLEAGEAALFYGNPQSASDPESPPSPTVGEIKQFLRVYLTEKTVTLLPTKLLLEVLTVPIEQIAPMPNMSPWVMGTYNRRGNILWLIDLGYLAGVKPLYQQTSVSSYTAAILQFGSADDTESIGLVFNRVGNIERCDVDSIQPVPSSGANTKLAKFLQGYWLKSEQEILALLDPDAIIEAISQS